MTHPMAAVNARLQRATWRVDAAMCDKVLPRRGGVWANLGMAPKTALSFFFDVLNFS